MDLENLSRIQKVEAPPFLFTKIQQKIEHSKKALMPKNISLIINLSFALLLTANGIALANYNVKPNATERFAKSMRLTSNNSFYP